MDIFDTVIVVGYMFLIFVISALILSGMFLNKLPKWVLRLVGCTGILISIIAIYMGYMNIKTSYNLFLAEGKCVTELVTLGVERKDITTFNGTCSWR
jgi:uncharacterized membrane protein|tara:strand:- start:260 stop:550 length:291 start_codon:yes stop_codon:yes gene_type:complete